MYGLVQWALHRPPALSHCIQILAYAPETKNMDECQHVNCIEELLELMADGLQGVSTERYFRLQVSIKMHSLPILSAHGRYIRQLYSVNGPRWSFALSDTLSSLGLLMQLDTHHLPHPFLLSISNPECGIKSF